MSRCARTLLAAACVSVLIAEYCKPLAQASGEGILDRVEAARPAGAEDGDPAARPLPGPGLHFQEDPDRPGFGTLLVTGLDPLAMALLRESDPDPSLWSLIFPVFTGDHFPVEGSQPPILGAWSIEAQGIRFTPRFPLATGLRFFARFDGARFDALTGAPGAPTPSLDLAFSMPDPGIHPTTHVTAVYPSGELVPENLLRLYVHFSAPMRDQVVLGMVRLFDDKGSEVDLSFVDVRRGLWDPSHRRLSLIFHPGRIKRGVGPHEVMGPPLRESGIYRLEVSAGLIDEQGFPMKERFERSYRVGAADRSSPDPATWRLSPPSDPRSPVILDLPEAMDHALMLRLVTVEDEEGEGVRGQASLEDGETRWTFAPESAWKPGRHAVVVHPALEDLAGNTPSRLFDEQTGSEQAKAVAAPASIRLPFTPGAGG